MVVLFFRIILTLYSRIAKASQQLEAMEFHAQFSPGAILSVDKKTASRNLAALHASAIFFIRQPLEDNVLFEVKIEAKRTITGGGPHSFTIGVTPQDPTAFAANSLDTWLCALIPSWTIYGDTTYKDGQPVAYNVPFGTLLDLNEGDRVGILRKPTGALHLFINGEDKGAVFSGIPTGCYAVVDVHGICTTVSIVTREDVKPGSISISFAPWTIAAFKDRMTAEEADGDSSVTSKKFVHGALPGLTWSLKVYPKGVGNAANDFIAMALCVEKSDKKSSATAPTGGFSLKLANVNGESTQLIFSAPAKSNSDTICMMEKFAQREMVEELCVGDGSVTISGKIFIERPYSLLGDHLRYLYESGISSDFTIQVENELLEFAVHKAIIRASPFFAGMFDNAECDETKQGKVAIKNASVDAVKAMLQFLYGDPLCFDNLLDLSIEVLKLSDQHQLISLKEVCEKALVGMITRENMLELALIADQFSAVVLRKAAFQFISNYQQ